MRLNDDFSKRVTVKAAENRWIASPMPGVDRKMLDRIGDEVARATTIVRYAPNSSFATHVHDGGEEFLVLKGVFQDEHGDYPAGTYVRNPPTSSHTPASTAGCTILVKLHQFQAEDRTFTRIDTTKAEPVAPVDRPGVRVLPLFRDDLETVRLEFWEPNTVTGIEAKGGLEAFVVRGGFTHDSDAFGPWDWVRLPDGDRLTATTGADGAQVWIKTGHLAGRGK